MGLETPVIVQRAYSVNTQFQSQSPEPGSRLSMSTTVQFINNLSTNAPGTPAHTHSHDGEASHTHGPGEHGHTHEHLDHPGKRRTKSWMKLSLTPIQGSMQSATCRTTLRATLRNGDSQSESEGVYISRTSVFALCLYAP